ncbi:MAG: response regulator transcription factor [Anaerolineae bacterium]|nr:response regulator transcription factor [Anaerolineae bacterium]
MTRVLIVDDQPAFRRSLRRLLGHVGVAVVGEAGDIVEAESLVRALQPDLAVLDLVLPGIDGLEGIGRLKALCPPMRVILISAHRNQASLLHEAARQAGAEFFISKDALDLDVVASWGTPRERGGEVTGT